MKEYTDAFGHKHYYDKEQEITGYCQVVGCMEHVPSSADNPYCDYHKGSGTFDDTKLLTKADFESAINSQGACNATGLIHSMNDLRERLWNTARSHNKGTEWVNAHPILQLYAYQLAHLCHGREPIEWAGYHNAYTFCNLVKDGIVDPQYDYSKEDWYGLKAEDWREIIGK